MASAHLGRTLVIANPTSHSGKGAAAAQRVQRFFESYRNASSTFDLELTHAPLEGVDIAAAAGGMDTVVALGGDGLIHEVVNGLMAIDQRDRPRLGIIPMGSGNDFARTLGCTPNNPDASLGELLGGLPRLIDLGLVRSDLVPEGPAPKSPGTYFMETLSFGLDAAIAIDTINRRSAGTSQEGSALFLTSSIKIVAAGSKGFGCTVRIDGGDPIKLQSLIFAIQNGPTYGGGFRICPDALPNDGTLNLCYNVKKPPVPWLMVLLGLARFGRHTRSRSLVMDTAKSVGIEFPDGDAPCQVDGEPLLGSRFAVSVVPEALSVIVPSGCRW